MRKEKNKKPIIAMCLLALVVIVGATFAYYTNSTTFDNEFQTSGYSTTTTEVFESPDDWTPGDETSKTLVTTNNEDIDVCVRVKMAEKWVSKNNKSLDLTFTDSDNNTQNAAVINYATDFSSKWGYDCDDKSYIYYKSKLAKGESTTTPILSVTYNEKVASDQTCTTKYYDKDGAEVESTAEYASKSVSCVSSGDGYDGGTYTLTLTTETIQCDAMEDAWGVALTDLSSTCE